MKKTFITIFCFLVLTQGLFAQAQEFKVGKSVSSKNWDITIVSVMDTGMNSWPILSKVPQFRVLKKGTYWKLKLRATYNGSAEKIGFWGTWVIATFTIHGQPPIQRISRMDGVIPHDPSSSSSSKTNKAIFGDPLVGTRTSKIPFEMEFLFAAPPLKDISSMQVQVLDCDPIKIEFEISI